MVFNLKGLMESIKPVDIGIGTFESINESFVEKNLCLQVSGLF